MPAEDERGLLTGVSAPSLSGVLGRDDPINREALREFLEDAGLIVDLAGHGGEAVSLAAINRYDAILMDLQKPDVDGLEATLRIRNSTANADVPIIALTANVFPADRARCLVGSMNAFIARPADSDAILGTLMRWL